MNIGMLWFDGGATADMGLRVRAAAEYYQSKYGRHPNVCFVHPSMLAGRSVTAIEGVELRTSDSVLREHLWLGVEEGASLDGGLGH